MRKPLLMIWLALPLGAWAYHEGPGQDGVQLDCVDQSLYEAQAAVADQDWQAAIVRYEEALESLPGDNERAARRIRLALNQARMMHKQLPVARQDLEQLTLEMVADEGADQDLLDQVRTAQASAHYYITWLMRLEGYPREAWEPEIEAARQTYRLLAERADARGEQDTVRKCREDLEAAVLLARMDLEELQGLPLPSQ